MGSTADKIAKLRSTKANIRAAIIARGVDVTSATVFADYPEKIAQIAGDAPVPEPGQHRVRFISPLPDAHGGYVIKTQYVDQGGSITSYPQAWDVDPAAVFNKWTHSLAQLANVQCDIDVGAMYDTVDGATYVDIEVTTVTGRAVPFYYVITGTATFMWDFGDGNTRNVNSGTALTNTFPANGRYRVRIARISGTGTLQIGGGTDTTPFIGGGSATYRQTLLQCFIGENVTTARATFTNCTSLTAVIFPEGTAVIDTNIFSGCTSLSSLVMPDGATSVDGAACYACSSLVYVAIPEGVERIGGSSFFNCYSLTSVVIPQSVTSFGTSVFNGCYSLVTVNIPEGIESIGNSFFNNCYSLASVVIPGSVISVGNTAFANCLSCKYYEFKSEIPPSFGTTAFSGIAATCKVCAPDDSVTAYKAATNLVIYANYIYPESQKPAV